MEGMGMMGLKSAFYSGKRVFVTGHTGFKGIWLCKLLELFGASVTGFSLPSPTNEGGKVFHFSGVEAGMNSITGDVRDFASLKQAFDEAKPDIVLHLAAQPIVLEGYKDPMGTYGTNVMGTVHILECVRQAKNAKSFLNVTTDKVYENREWIWGYRENEPLDGFDPYSNSKSCSELVTHSYQRSFFSDGACAISTARAGNVIGGGDFSPNRIVPDCVRAAFEKKEIVVRNPNSVRPYQHVLEPLYAYLLIAQAQYEDSEAAGWYNVGPDDEDCVTTGELTDLFCEFWGERQSWKSIESQGPHEANFLKLDCSKLKNILGWRPRWHVRKAMEETVAWAKVWRNNPENISSIMEQQIKEFLEEGDRLHDSS